MNQIYFCRTPPLILSTIGIMLLFVFDCANFSFSVSLTASNFSSKTTTPWHDVEFGVHAC